MKKFACIGSRKISARVMTEMMAIGTLLVERGHIIRSGNAHGSDQAYAAGAYAAGRDDLVELYLPWAGYEKQAIREGNRVFRHDPPSLVVDVARAAHPAWDRLSQGVRKMMVRNAMIILGKYGDDPVNGCIAYLNHNKPGGGGTGHGVRICEIFNIPVWDISNENTMNWVLRRLQ